jgi:hypothetical protein
MGVKMFFISAFQRFLHIIMDNYCGREKERLLYYNTGNEVGSRTK